MAWQDPWAGESSDAIKRTGTGVLLASQDGRATAEAFTGALRRFGADFYVHHALPGDPNDHIMLRDVARAGLGLVLANEYGNINGPYQSGTNRWDVPAWLVTDAAATVDLRGVLYDEPEHLQINADQYRKDGFHPQFGSVDGMPADAAVDALAGRVAGIVGGIHAASNAPTPVLSEQVFPTLFHALARGGMSPCPKVMKESFQPLQLATALGAAQQYQRDFWICVDLWGPDIGPWFTRAPGFPGHSPEEYASALRLAYFFGPSHLFTEGIDVLMRLADVEFRATEFGEVWLEFVSSFVPSHPLPWRSDDARPAIAIVHAEDSNYGQTERPFGKRGERAPERSESVFDVWHLLSHGTIPRHGSCMHIPGYHFPRHRLNSLDRAAYPFPDGAPGVDAPTRLHGLFQPMNSALVFDEYARAADVEAAALIVAAGTRLPAETREMLRTRAEAGATVVIAAWLDPERPVGVHRLGRGTWSITEDFLSDEVAEVVAPHLGRPDRWTQRFGDYELRISPRDADGIELDFEAVAG
jgi:hypothetical protein